MGNQWVTAQTDLSIHNLISASDTTQVALVFWVIAAICVVWGALK